jgi:hypothetical protein
MNQAQILHKNKKHPLSAKISPEKVQQLNKTEEKIAQDHTTKT